MSELTQTQQVMMMLENNDFVCGVTFQQTFIPTYAQRISDINKKATDFRIVGQKCDISHHTHKGNVFMYSIVRNEVTHEQTCLLA